MYLHTYKYLNRFIVYFLDNHKYPIKDLTYTKRKIINISNFEMIWVADEDFFWLPGFLVDVVLSGVIIDVVLLVVFCDGGIFSISL